MSGKRASSPSALKRADSPSRGLSTTFANAKGGPLSTIHTYEEHPDEKSVDPLEKLKQTLNEMNNAPPSLSQEEEVKKILAVVKNTTLTNSDGKWTAEFCSEAGQCIAVALTVAAAILLIRWTSASSMGGGRRSRSRKNQKNRKTRRRH